MKFSIARDGRLLNPRVVRSSGYAEADQAAIQAVQAAAPYRSLPDAFSQNSISIEFTFDYNVYKGSSTSIRRY